MSDPFDTRREVRYGVPEEIAPGIRRVTCPNPSPMTFTGTQTYLVGRGRIAMIDPGPDDAAHLDAVLNALRPGERVEAVLVTHTHRDHSPGAARIARETGAEVLAFGPHGAGMSPAMRALAADGAEIGGGEGADPDFRPDREIGEGAVVRVEGAEIEALHTPGHLSNHLSFAETATGAVFTGDAVMGWATTLVSPPEGDMAAQMATLRRLAARQDRMFLPGHGHPVATPARLLGHQIAHREARAAQILAALDLGPATAEALAERIYTDIDPRLMPAAARNVFATLLGLADAGRALAEGPVSATTRFRRV